MTLRQPSRNAPCPCGSGKKFKHCCRNKGFDWLEDEHGQTGCEVPLDCDTQAILEQQCQKFRQHFGRDMEPDDRLFFDAPPLEQVEHRLVEAMQRAGLDPAFIHAFEQTGLLVSTDNQHLIPAADLARWHAAVAEYRNRNDADT